MSFALAGNKGPASTWDNLRAERKKKQKRGQSLNRKAPTQVTKAYSTLARTLVELASKFFLAGVIGYILFAGYNFLISAPRFQIQDVSFRGNRELTKLQIVDWLGPVEGKNLFATDLAELTQRLSEHPWVQSASIQRQFPQGLKIELTERVPYARIKLDQVYLMDNFGTILSPEKPEYRHLPLIILQENKKKDNNFFEDKVLHSLKTMHYFNKLSFFENNPLDTAELRGNSRILFITRNRDLQIQMSMDALNEGFKIFMIILDTLEEENLKIQMIDLSFKDQVIIRDQIQLSSTLISAKSQTN